MHFGCDIPLTYPHLTEGATEAQRGRNEVTWAIKPWQGCLRGESSRTHLMTSSLGSQVKVLSEGLRRAEPSRGSHLGTVAGGPDHQEERKSVRPWAAPSCWARNERGSSSSVPRTPFFPTFPSTLGRAHSRTSLTVDNMQTGSARGGCKRTAGFWTTTWHVQRPGAVKELGQGGGCSNCSKFEEVIASLQQPPGSHPAPWPCQALSTGSPFNGSLLCAWLQPEKPQQMFLLESVWGVGQGEKKFF